MVSQRLRHPPPRVGTEPGQHRPEPLVGQPVVRELLVQAELAYGVAVPLAAEEILDVLGGSVEEQIRRRDAALTPERLDGSRQERQRERRDARREDGTMEPGTHGQAGTAPRASAL
jgi:hypothetical protein